MDTSQQADSGWQPPGSLERVILITVDGLMPDSYLDPDARGLSVPTLRAMHQGGAYSPGMLATFPTVTYPNHASLATGANPGTHGILSNKTFDPLARNQDGWYWYEEDLKVSTLWQKAEAAGMRTALINWPSTVGASADALVPEYWRAGTPDDVKLAKALSTPGLLDAVAARFLDFWDTFTPPDVLDKASIDIAIHLIETAPPDLMMIHIWMVDEFQHRNGPWSAEGNAMIEEADAQIARLIAALQEANLWEGTALVVASDHGFLATSARARPAVPLVQNGLITLDASNKVTAWKASVNVNSAMAYVYVADETDQATKDQVATIYSALVSTPDSGFGQVFIREEIIAKGGDPNAFLAVEAAPGTGFAAGFTGALQESAPPGGTHGWDPELPDMKASLLIYGPRIAASTIADARIIDISPTIAGWLGLSLPQAEGAALEVSLTDP